MLGFWLVAAAFVPLLLALLLLTWGRAAHTLAPPMLRAWGQAMLRLCGVKLQVDPLVERELRQRRRRVVTLNHTSTLDMFVSAALWQPGMAAVVKREALWVPLIGQAMYLLGFPIIDRANREKATATLRAAAQRVQSEHLTLIIAPEGTRSETGQLGAFRLGPFHLAAQADAPILPLLFFGTAQLWPRRQLQCNAGVVTVRMLPEQPSGAHDQSADAMHRRALALHDAYAAALAQENREGERHDG